MNERRSDEFALFGQSARGADGIEVPARFIPTPTTVSPEAQAFFRLRIPNGGSRELPAADDAEGWKALRDRAEAGVVAMTRRYTERFPSTVEAHALAASTIHEITPEDIAPESRNRALYYIHGGGFTSGGGQAAINFAIQFAGLARCRTYAIDYRKAPEFPFPAPLDDTLEGYRFVVDRHGPGHIGVFGLSAGANLTAALGLKARDTGMPLPAALSMFSCPSDMTTWGDSGETNQYVDIILHKPMPQISELYAGGHDMLDPYMSPLFGDYAKGFPPTVLGSGTRDLLLSGTVRLHRAMVKAGVNAHLHVWEAMPHAPLIGAPEEEEVYLQMIDFLFRHMAQ